MSCNGFNLSFILKLIATSVDDDQDPIGHSAYTEIYPKRQQDLKTGGWVGLKMSSYWFQL